MSDSPAEQTRYWLLIGDVPQGPFDVAQVHDKLASGEATWRTSACPFGQSNWQPLRQWPELASTSALSPVSHSDAFTTAPVEAPRTNRPASHPAEVPTDPTCKPTPCSWNPTVLAWLGLVFSPLWVGVMASINGYRLGLTAPWWRPVLLVVSATLLDFLIGLGYESYLLSLCLFVGAVFLVWLTDLRTQAKEYDLHVNTNLARAGWVLPVLCGLPLAALSLYAFVIEPLTPLTPRQVCEGFMKARSEAEMKKYVTLNLWPALVTLSRLESKGPDPDWELTHEESDLAEVGYYSVGYRLVFLDAKEAHQMEGEFDLVQREGAWKIEEMYITAIDGQRLDPRVAMSRDYQNIANASGRGVPPEDGAFPPLEKVKQK